MSRSDPLPAPNEKQRLAGWRRRVFLFGGLAAAAMIWGLVLFFFPDPAVSTRKGLLWTGRLAFLVFLIPLLARPLRKLIQIPLTAKLMRWRRNAGIVYGAIQVIHLLMIARLFQVSSGNPVDGATLVVGGLGITLVMAMLLTSFDGPANKLSRRQWRFVHKSGLYVCSFIYLYDFVIKPMELGKSLEYAPLTALTLLGLGVRFLAVLPRRRPAAVESNA